LPFLKIPENHLKDQLKMALFDQQIGEIKRKIADDRYP
jgi:hypothetical protein